MSRTGIVVVPLLLIPIAALTGCSALDRSASSAAVAVAPAGEAAAAGGAASEAVADAAPRPADYSAADKGGPAAPARVGESQVIRSAAVLLAADDIDAAHTRLLAAVDNADGSVTAESVGTNPPYPSDPQPYAAADKATAPALPTYRYVAGRWVEVTFTVPQDHYAAAVASVRGVGQVADFAQSADDVTATVADLDARTTTAKASIARITALMNRAEKIGDILALENELTTRTADLESLQAQSRALAAQTATSTIRVHLVTAAALAAADPAAGVPAGDTWWSKAVDALAAAWSGVAVAVAATSPLWLLGGLVAYVAWRLLRRARRTPPVAAE